MLPVWTSSDGWMVEWIDETLPDGYLLANCEYLTTAKLCFIVQLINRTAYTDISIDCMCVCVCVSAPRDRRNLPSFGVYVLWLYYYRFATNQMFSPAILLCFFFSPFTLCILLNSLYVIRRWPLCMIRVLFTRNFVYELRNQMRIHHTRLTITNGLDTSSNNVSIQVWVCVSSRCVVCFSVIREWTEIEVQIMKTNLGRAVFCLFFLSALPYYIYMILL